MSDLIAEILKRLERLEEKPDLQDAVATGDNTVLVGNSTVAVTLPAIIPVASGDFCQVLTKRNGNRVIVGPTGTPTVSVFGHTSPWTTSLSALPTMTFTNAQASRAGRTVNFWLYIEHSSGSGSAATATFTLPDTALGSANFRRIGGGYWYNGATAVPIDVICNNSTSLAAFYVPSSAGLLQGSSIAAGHEINVSGSFLATSYT